MVGLLSEADEALLEALDRFLSVQQASFEQTPLDGKPQPSRQGTLVERSVPGRPGIKRLFPRFPGVHTTLLLLQQPRQLLCDKVNANVMGYKESFIFSVVTFYLIYLQAGSRGFKLWEGKTLSQWKMCPD